MEYRMGHDFSDVRIHADSAADKNAQDLNAHAYTVGTDIFFASGKYQPEITEGKKLLAHELTHVIQNRNSQVLLSHLPAMLLNDRRMLYRLRWSAETESLPQDF